MRSNDKRIPRAVKDKKEVTPATAMWVGVLLMVVCGCDSGMQGWVPTLDHTLLLVQGISVAVLLLIAVIRDIQLKSDQSIPGLIVWILFLEMSIVLHADLGYTQYTELQLLKSHGIKAGAKIIEAQMVFEPRGSDKRPALAKVTWLVTLNDGTIRRAEAIESGSLYFASRINQADFVRYLPENPSLVRSETSVERLPVRKAEELTRLYLMLLLIPSAVNTLICMRVLAIRSQKPVDKDDSLAPSQPPAKSKSPRRNFVLVFSIAIGSGVMLLILPKILEAVHVSSEPEPENAVHHAKPALADNEIFPSPNIPRAVAPYLMPDAALGVVRWEREQNGNTVLYQGFDIHNMIMCEFECHKSDNGLPQVDHEYFITYQNHPQSGSYMKGCATEIRVICSTLERQTPDSNQKSFQGHIVTTYQYSVVGTTLFLTYAIRYHEVNAAGSCDDSLFVKFTRDQNQHLLHTTTAYDKPFDLNAKKNLLQEKFLLWSKFGQIQ